MNKRAKTQMMKKNHKCNLKCSEDHFAFTIQFSLQKSYNFSNLQLKKISFNKKNKYLFKKFAEINISSLFLSKNQSTNFNLYKKSIIITISHL
ncbi:hypothetical protein J2X97_002309 [Epilithonimonas hungarica]|nr:hypothetical protein [Epilithonimonas hungarica]